MAYARRTKAEYAILSPHPERWPLLVDGLRAMWRSEPSFTKQNLAEIKVPIAVVDGEYDEIIKREHTEFMAHAIPGAKLLILPAVSHFAMLQDPERFTEVLTAFLAA